MRKYLLWLTLAVPCWGALTTVQDTLYRADGGYCSGAVTLTWETFVAPDGKTIYAGSWTYPVAGAVNGLSITLEPGQYTANYAITPTGCAPAYEQWIVPVGTTVNLGAVRSINPPTPYTSIGLSWLAQGGAALNQALVWNGSAWVPGTVTSGVSSVFTRTGAVTAQTGDYTPAQVGAPALDGTGATGTWGISVSGNAGTATALAANGANCNAGYYPLGVDASGAVESCTAAAVGDVTAVGDCASGNCYQAATANYVYAGPTTGAAAPAALRALVSADIPANAANTSGNAGTATALAADPADCTNQFARGIAASGAAACASVAGTDFGTQTANRGLFGPASGSAATPAFRALVQADMPSVVPACTKFTVTTSGGYWTVNAVQNAALTAGLTQTITVGTNLIPANGEITSLRIKHSTAFAGTSITAMTVTLSDGVTEGIYAPAWDVFQATGNNVLWVDGGAFTTTAAANSLTATFTAVGANLSAISAGSVDVWACVRTLP